MPFVCYYNINNSYHSIDTNQIIDDNEEYRLLIDIQKEPINNLSKLAGYVDIKKDLNKKMISVYSCFSD